MRRYEGERSWTAERVMLHAFKLELPLKTDPLELCTDNPFTDLVQPHPHVVSSRKRLMITEESPLFQADDEVLSIPRTSSTLDSTKTKEECHIPVDDSPQVQAQKPSPQVM